MGKRKKTRRNTSNHPQDVKNNKKKTFNEMTFKEKAEYVAKTIGNAVRTASVEIAHFFRDVVWEKGIKVAALAVVKFFKGLFSGEEKEQEEKPKKAEAAVNSSISESAQRRFPGVTSLRELSILAKNSASGADDSYKEVQVLTAELSAINSKIASLRTPKDADEETSNRLSEERAALRNERDIKARKLTITEAKGRSLEVAADEYAYLYKCFTGKDVDYRDTERFAPVNIDITDEEVKALIACLVAEDRVEAKKNFNAESQEGNFFKDVIWDKGLKVAYIAVVAFFADTVFPFVKASWKTWWFIAGCVAVVVIVVLAICIPAANNRKAETEARHALEISVVQEQAAKNLEEAKKAAEEELNAVKNAAAEELNAVKDAAAVELTAAKAETEEVKKAADEAVSAAKAQALMDVSKAQKKAAEAVKAAETKAAEEILNAKTVAEEAVKAAETKAAEDVAKAQKLASDAIRAAQANAGAEVANVRKTAEEALKATQEITNEEALMAVREEAAAEIENIQAAADEAIKAAESKAAEEVAKAKKSASDAIKAAQANANAEVANVRKTAEEALKAAQKITNEEALMAVREEAAAEIASIQAAADEAVKAAENKAAEEVAKAKKSASESIKAAQANANAEVAKARKAADEAIKAVGEEAAAEIASIQAAADEAIKAAQENLAVADKTSAEGGKKSKYSAEINAGLGVTNLNTIPEPVVRLGGRLMLPESLNSNLSVGIGTAVEYNRTNGFTFIPAEIAFKYSF